MTTISRRITLRKGDHTVELAPGEHLSVDHVGAGAFSRLARIPPEPIGALKHERFGAPTVFWTPADGVTRIWPTPDRDYQALAVIDLTDEDAESVVSLGRLMEAAKDRRMPPHLRDFVPEDPRIDRELSERLFTDEFPTVGPPRGETDRWKIPEELLKPGGVLVEHDPETDLHAALDACRQAGLMVGCQVVDRETVVVWLGDIQEGLGPQFRAWGPLPTAVCFQKCWGSNALDDAAGYVWRYHRDATKAAPQPWKESDVRVGPTKRPD